MELCLAYMDRVREVKKRETNSKIRSAVERIREGLEERISSSYIGMPNDEMTQARVMMDLQAEIHRLIAQYYARRLDESIMSGFQTAYEQITEPRVMINEQEVGRLQSITMNPYVLPPLMDRSFFETEMIKMRIDQALSATLRGDRDGDYYGLSRLEKAK